MKQLKRVFVVVLVLVCWQGESAFAQVGTLISLGVRGGMALARNGDHETKEEKLIDRSSKQEKINGSNITVLRIKDSEIKSKAKGHIIALQNRLDQYATQYKNNEPLDIPKNDSDLIAIQNKDENWPIEYYVTELRAYKRYALQQKQKAPAVPANGANTTTVEGAKKDTAAERVVNGRH